MLSAEASRDTIAPQVDVYAPTAEELNAMTLQVGLVGSDGIVIASDRLMGQWEGRAFSQMMTSKFLRGAHTLCCWSGDSVSQRAAYAIRELAPSQLKEEIRQQLKEAGDAAWRELGIPGKLAELGVARKVMVALPGSEWPLWLLEISSKSFANEVHDKAVAGDDRNTARHFSNNYAPYPPPSVENLIVLAAHVILSGGEENPSGVAGLEVAVVRGSEVTVLSADQERELTDLSRLIAKRLEDDLLQPFSMESR